MNGFILGSWHHVLPNKTFDLNGRRGIVRHLCFGPLETQIYGITSDNQYYYEYSILEGIEEGERTFYFIDKGELLKAIDKEILLCRENHAEKMMQILEEERDLIEHSEYPLP